MAENCVNFEAEAMKTTSSVASTASPLSMCTAAVVASREKSFFTLHIMRGPAAAVLEGDTRATLAPAI